MKLLKAIFALIMLSLACSISYGQSYIPFATGRTTDTARTTGSLLVPFYVRLPIYGSSDSNKVLGVLPNGMLVLRTKGNGGAYSAGYGLDLTGSTFSVDTTEIASKEYVDSRIPDSLNHALVINAGLSSGGVGYYNGSQTITMANTLATGLGDDQTVYGGTNANGDLALQGTLSVTKTTSNVNIQPDGGKISMFTTSNVTGIDVNINGSYRANSGFINTVTQSNDTVYFWGNSITVGFGLASIVYRWSTIVCRYLNMTEINNAVSNSHLEDRTPACGSGSFLADYLNTIPTKTTGKKYAVIMYGINDISCGISNPNYNPVNFSTDYNIILDTFIARGWANSDILITTTTPKYNWTGNGATQQPIFNDTIRAIANRRGNKLFDAYKFMDSRGGVLLLQTDGTHVNNEGNLLIANGIINKLGYSVETDSQKFAVNGLTQLNNIQFTGTDTVVVDSVIGAVVGKKDGTLGLAPNYFVRNNFTTTANAGQFNINGSGKVGATFKAGNLFGVLSTSSVTFPTTEKGLWAYYFESFDAAAIYGYDYGTSTSKKIALQPDGGNISIGISPSASLSAKLTVRGAGVEQVRIENDASNYLSTTINSSGVLTWDAVGSASQFIISDKTTVNPALPNTAANLDGFIVATTTTAGTNPTRVQGGLFTLGAGYTGAGKTFGLQASNAVAGTGNDLMLSAFGSAPLGNNGFCGFAVATTTGLNVGNSGEAAGGNINVSLLGKATTAKNSATNIGVLGVALNTGSSPINIGGYFGLINSTPTFTSAALIANNGATTNPIFKAQDNGTDVLTVADGGAVISTGTISTTKYFVSALNTPPANAGDTGTTGEIRFGSDGYLYLCTATNTWLRVQLVTW